MTSTCNSSFKIKDFPPDVSRHICSFGYPEHKEHMKEVSNQLTGLLEYNLSLLHEDYIKLLKIDYVQCIFDYFVYTVDFEVLKDLFKQCIKCCCCSKHCHNRPINFNTDKVSIGENFNTSEICHCKCRQVARHIKRAQPYLRAPSRSINNTKSTITITHNKKIIEQSTFNIQFIPLSSRTHLHRVPFHQENQLAQS
jgi:hypothetical protein